jgi:hypothetical protein
MTSPPGSCGMTGNPELITLAQNWFDSKLDRDGLRNQAVAQVCAVCSPRSRFNEGHQYNMLLQGLAERSYASYRFLTLRNSR